ncbi:unnamed protein product [Effrenium voratum]|nr:unnamed protein product [Effrenium voratum]
MQKCGQSFWWDTLVQLRAIQLQKGVRLSPVELSIVMTSLAFCLRSKGKFQVLPQRVPAALAIAQETWNPLSHSTYAAFLEHYGHHDEVDTVLAKENVDTGKVELNCVTLGALLDIAASQKDLQRHSSLEAAHLHRLQELLSTHSALIDRKASRHMARYWKRFQEVAKNLSTQPTLSLHDVLIEWKAKNLSSMAAWPNFAAGENYLQAMPSAARKEMGDKLSIFARLGAISILLPLLCVPAVLLVYPALILASGRTRREPDLLVMGEALLTRASWLWT